MDKRLFNILQCTWGILDNLVGFILGFILVLCGYKAKKYHGIVYFEVGKHYGGFNFGFVAVVNENPTRFILTHELGHFNQNAYFGIFMPFIQLASICRYWYRRIRKIYDNKYYDIWFEKQANELGKDYIDRGW